MIEHKFPESRELDIELNDEIAEGEYSNLVIISHSTSEFVLDFVRMMPGVSKARIKSRIVLAPEHAKGLLLSLQENIERDRKSTRLNSSHANESRMPSSA